MLAKCFIIAVLAFGIMASVLDILLTGRDKPRPRWFPLAWVAIGVVTLGGALIAFILWTGLA